MPVFYFNLRDGTAGVVDTEGTELADLDAAKTYATEVARELIKGNEPKKRTWQLEVFCDGEKAPVFVVPFATVDPTLDHLEPGLRRVVERLAESRRAIGETLFGSESLVFYTRAIGARLTGRPYLAARFGQRVDVPPQSPFDLHGSADADKRGVAR